MEDILDIKPPEAFGIHPAWRQYLLYGLLILLAVALVVAAVYFWKKYRRRKTAPIPAEPAHGKALRLLDELGRKTGVDPRMFYFQLSAILRGYMEARFGIDALEMTSEELLPRIGELGLERGLHRGVRDFIMTSDPVKFAGSRADARKMEADMEFVRTFVTQTAVRPDETDAVSLPPENRKPS